MRHKAGKSRRCTGNHTKRRVACGKAGLFFGVKKYIFTENIERKADGNDTNAYAHKLIIHMARQ